MSIFKQHKKSKIQEKKPSATPVPPASSKGGGPRPEKPRRDNKKERASVAAKPVGSNLILFPLLTEKATSFQNEDKYVFVVKSGANKSEIKKEVERLFDIRVESVNILKAKRKSRLWRGIKGHRPGYKKAVVTVEKGKKIEILPT